MNESSRQEESAAKEAPKATPKEAEESETHENEETDSDFPWPGDQVADKSAKT